MPYRLHVSLIHRGDWSELSRNYPGLSVVGLSSYVVKPSELTLEVVAVHALDSSLIRDFTHALMGGLGNVVKVLYVNNVSRRYREVVLLSEYDGVLKYVLINNGCLTVQSRVHNGVKEFTAYFTDKSNAESSCRALTRRGDVDLMNCSLVRVKGESFSNGLSLGTMLTHRELQVLRRAYEAGFFDDTRGIGLSELAREFGLSKSTVSHHIRSAVRKIIKLYLSR
ncbi:helix-turn-helix domain-containing protein [Caldivirga maquilingensis]|uniref:Bacterio-opsin activator HTH domain protein n=1 Tax=Caldivirga maquilingensis (strain ATCC 700844 / DSM 13496 / JCM 10307 / IC-167) TaxID=397948 RepID=A8MD53_CALMQ|nr:helix-turn-helix domain-containing protein [Caldivirga maquilingensis]ABW01709.1 Bacterio-opsin activator HTH domain protein [Caldivirga maquilingensis IC-167]